MKNLLNSIMLLLLAGTSALMVSCKDDDINGSSTNTNREFMTMFITDNTRGKGSDYPYNCDKDYNYSPHGNSIHLYWYGVNDCAGYQIQMGLQIKVSGGAEAWKKVQGTSDLLLDTIVGPKQLDMLLKDLQYSTNYRFAIRALSKKDQNIKGDESTFAHASNWYGHGNGRQWQEYLGITTDDRYPTPMAIYVNQAQTTETDMHVYFNTNIEKVVDGINPAVQGNDSDKEKAENNLAIVKQCLKEYIENPNPDKSFSLPNVNDLTLSDDDKDKIEAYVDNFNIDKDGNFGYKYLTVVPSPNNPNSTVNEKWKKYEITDEDRTRGYVVVDGLTANSVYVIDVIDPTVPVEIDAKYNTCTARSDGQPGKPILLKHEDLLATQTTAGIPDRDDYKRNEVYVNAANFNAAPLTPTLYDFISNTDYAEGQTFLLEGGKTYYLDGNDITCKGFVLRTDPADVEKNLRAKVICGIGLSPEGQEVLFNQGNQGHQWDGCPYSMFTFGRSPEAGEGGEIYMKKLAFYDIDFDNPMCFNYGDEKAGIGKSTGNYFFNMFSDGMAVTLDSLVIENCTFKRIVRGFVREQGPNYKLWNHVLIKDNLFYDCGYYSNGAGGYCWIDGAGNNGKTNMLADFKAIENTFYDCPFPAFIKQQLAEEHKYEGNSKWNITFSNNTLVNYNTRGDDAKGTSAIFKVSRVPNGSVFNVENNLIILCKQSGDQRNLSQQGCIISDTETLPDGSAGVVTLNFNNNWSTNNDLTNGSIFSAKAWDNEKDGFGSLVTNQKAKLNGSLKVSVADISATDLLISPCPPHIAATAEDQNMHRADALDGTATTQYNVNLYFKDKNNDIWNNNVGAARWRKK